MDEASLQEHTDLGDKTKDKDKDKSFNREKVSKVIDGEEDPGRLRKAQSESSLKLLKRKFYDMRNHFFPDPGEIRLSAPTNFRQPLHIGYNKESGKFEVPTFVRVTWGPLFENVLPASISVVVILISWWCWCQGMPDEWQTRLSASGITKTEISQDPKTLVKVLQFQDGMISNNQTQQPTSNTKNTHEQIQRQSTSKNDSQKTAQLKNHKRSLSADSQRLKCEEKALAIPSPNVGGSMLAGNPHNDAAAGKCSAANNNHNKGKVPLKSKITRKRGIGSLIHSQSAFTHQVTHISDISSDIPHSQPSAPSTPSSIAPLSSQPSLLSLSSPIPCSSHKPMFKFTSKSLRGSKKDLHKVKPPEGVLIEREFNDAERKAKRKSAPITSTSHTTTPEPNPPSEGKNPYVPMPHT